MSRARTSPLVAKARAAVATMTIEELRTLALELIESEARLRSILEAVSADDGTKAARVEMHNQKGGGLHLIVVGAVDEEHIARLVMEAQAVLFAEAGIELTPKGGENTGLLRFGEEPPR